MHSAKDIKKRVSEVTQPMYRKMFCLPKCTLKPANKHNTVLSAENIQHAQERTP